MLIGGKLTWFDFLFFHLGTTTSTKSSRLFRTRGLCTSSEAERTTGGNRSWKGRERQGCLVRHRCDFEYILLLKYIWAFGQVGLGIYCNLKIYWNAGIKKSDLMPPSLGSTANHMEVWRMSSYVSVQQRTWGDRSTWESSCKRLSKAYSLSGAHINMSWNIEVAWGPI